MKYKLEISCPLNTRSAPHSTQVQLLVSSCHCKYMCIIENRQRGTPCPMTQELSHIKMTRQQTMSISAILLFDICIGFLLRMLHRLLTMVMLQVSTMIRHGLGQPPRHFSNTHTNSMILQVPLLFHTTRIHKQKNHDINGIISAMLKAFPMTAWFC